MSIVISLAAIVLLTVADQLIKSAVVQNLMPVGSIPFIDGFVGWRYLENKGAAFGIFSNNTVVLAVFTGLVIVLGLYLIAAKKIQSKYYLTCAVMIIAGGAGNMIDRVFRGYVVDFIEVQFMDFAVFNFADILVTVGAFMLVIYLIADIIRDSKKGDKSE